MTNPAVTVESTPRKRAPFAADVVVMGEVERERVMVHPATTRTFYCNGTPIYVDVAIVTACGIVDRVDPDWCRPR
jgi:hypothetical protein